MKQQPTKKQWLELHECDGETLCRFFKFKVDRNNPPNIGQMIEFLGDDWVNAFKCGCEHQIEFVCDTLWEAVKYKLNKLK